MTHGIDLAALTRAQLKTLAGDVADELAQREHNDRIAFEDKVKQMAEEAGFDPDQVRFGKPAARRGKSKHKNGASDHA